MAISITELVKPLVKSEVLADVYTLLGLGGLTTTANEPTEPVPVLIGTVVEWFVDDVWNALVVPALRAPFLDFASGTWLSLIAALVYNRPRFLDTPATGTITVENRGSFTGTIAVGQLRIKSTVTNKTYTNKTSGTLSAWIGSGAYPEVDLIFEADQSGTGSNAQPGDIDTGLVLGPVGIYAQTNVAPMLGQDEESDANLKARCKAAISEGVAGGPRASYESAALDPVGVFVRRKVPYPSTWGTAAPNISRIRILSIGGGVVSVRLASTSGAAVGDNVTEDSDVFKANAAIQLFCVPPGITCTVSSAAEKAIALGSITLYVARESGVSVEEAKAAAEAALVSFFSTLPIGGAKKVANGIGYVLGEKVEAVLNAPDYVVGNTYSPTDTALLLYEVAVPSYTISVQLVTQS